MEAVAFTRPPLRPACPRHPDSCIRLDGYIRCRWSDAHRRPRYRCVTEPRSRGHAFSLPVPVRQPTAHHPDSGVACSRCEHVFERHEGVRTGIDFTFGNGDMARLFVRLGEGMSLRQASSDLRRSLFRLAAGETSRQANLADQGRSPTGPCGLDAFDESTGSGNTWWDNGLLHERAAVVRIPGESRARVRSRGIRHRRAERS